MNDIQPEEENDGVILLKKVLFFIAYIGTPLLFVYFPISYYIGWLPLQNILIGIFNNFTFGVYLLGVVSLAYYKFIKPTFFDNDNNNIFIIGILIMTIVIVIAIALCFMFHDYILMLGDRHNMVHYDSDDL